MFSVFSLTIGLLRPMIGIASDKLGRIFFLCLFSAGVPGDQSSSGEAADGVRHRVAKPQRNISTLHRQRSPETQAILAHCLSSEWGSTGPWGLMWPRIPAPPTRSATTRVRLWPSTQQSNLRQGEEPTYDIRANTIQLPAARGIGKPFG